MWGVFSIPTEEAFGFLDAEYRHFGLVATSPLVCGGGRYPTSLLIFHRD